jgi:hypothetical protein
MTESTRGSPATRSSKRYLAALIYIGGIIVVGYLSYLYGWYTGVVQETVKADIENGRVALQASKALRLGQPERALWIQDLAVEGYLYSLQQLTDIVPPRFQSEHRILVQEIVSYRGRYPDANKGTKIEEFRTDR